MKNQSKVLVIYTGGTIGMVNDPATGALTAFDFGDVYKHIPELSRLNVGITTHAFENPIDSSEMNPEVWAHLAEFIQSEYANYDGFVVLHGSDTMAFTASALSFMMQGIEKPIILTGSQLPIGTIRTDGKENLITAVEIAAAKHADGSAIIREVAIYFEYSLYRGNRTSKISASAFEAFRSPNFPPLAVAGVHINYADKLHKPNREFSVFTEFNQNVLLIKLFPGIDWNLLAPAIDAKKVKGIVLETYGSGNASSNASFQQILSKYLADGGIVLNITQCSTGSVEQGKYETSSFFERSGVISGHDLTSEAAITKMMYAIGISYGNVEKTKEILKSDVCGEITLLK
jgi:L-asparaginase